MRVLLFVQTGDGRPKCAGRLRMVGLFVHGTNARQDAAIAASDRHWAVECLDAKHGRAVIAGSRTLDSAEFGRILASGGRS